MASLPPRLSHFAQAEPAFIQAKSSFLTPGHSTQAKPLANSAPTAPAPRPQQQQLVQNNRRRTEVAPAPVVSNEKQPAKRKRRRADSNSPDAPYVRLVSITDDDPNAMDVEDVDGLKSRNFQAFDRIKDPMICCIYCHDVGPYIWTCQAEGCGNPVCVGLSECDHGCVNIFSDPETGNMSVTEKTFMCPRCHRDKGLAMTYNVQGYSVRQDFLYRNRFPLLAIFLSWSGFESPFASNLIRLTLEEHYRRDKSRLHIMTRALRAGNNCPQAMTPSFDWMREFNYEGNLLIFVNTHSDTKTGNLVVSGNERNPTSIPIYELLSKYIGDHNLRAATHAISAINKKAGVGPCIRGLVICACGSTGRLDDSALLLTRFVKEDILDFVLTFSGVSTMDPVVVPALNRFIENVYVYGLQMWDALEESFGEDRHALNQSPVFLSFAEMKTNGDKVRQRTVHTRVLAYSNLRDGRPWGLDIYRCLSAACNAPAYNMVFHPHGKQYYGKQWVQTKIKYECLECGVVQKAISCPPWIHAARSQNYGRVWYEWPLSAEHKRDIGIIC